MLDTAADTGSHGNTLSMRPWSCVQELRQVHELLYATDPSARRRGAAIVSMWAQRAGQHQVARGALLCAELVTALGCADAAAARGALALALTRFVTLAAGEEQDRAKLSNAAPITSLAARLHIPDWLVAARHDVVHGQLPATPMLRLACECALDWLQQYFWTPSLADLTAQAQTRVDGDARLEALLLEFAAQRLDTRRRGGLGARVTGCAEPELGALREALLPAARRPAGVGPRLVALLLSWRCLLAQEREAALSALDATGGLHADLYRMWAPLFKLLHECELLTSLVQASLLLVQARGGGARQPLVRAWAACWLTGMLRATDAKFPLSVALRDVRRQLNWRAVCHHLVAAQLAPDTLVLAELVLEAHLPALGIAEKRRIHALNDAFLAVDYSTAGDAADDEAGAADEEAQLVNWSTYPLGTCPKFAVQDYDWIQQCSSDASAIGSAAR